MCWNIKAHSSSPIDLALEWETSLSAGFFWYINISWFNFPLSVSVSVFPLSTSLCVAYVRWELAGLLFAINKQWGRPAQSSPVHLCNPLMTAGFGTLSFWWASTELFFFWWRKTLPTCYLPPINHLLEDEDARQFFRPSSSCAGLYSGRQKAQGWAVYRNIILRRDVIFSSVQSVRRGSIICTKV